MKENVETPTSKIMQANILSSMLWGVKSPYPIVDSVVIAKYQSLTRIT